MTAHRNSLCRKTIETRIETSSYEKPQRQQKETLSEKYSISENLANNNIIFKYTI